jgi:hypothetical protein
LTTKKINKEENVKDILNFFQDGDKSSTEEKNIKLTQRGRSLINKPTSEDATLANGESGTSAQEKDIFNKYMKIKPSDESSNIKTEKENPILEKNNGLADFQKLQKETKEKSDYNMPKSQKEVEEPTSSNEAQAFKQKPLNIEVERHVDNTLEVSNIERQKREENNKKILKNLLSFENSLSKSSVITESSSDQKIEPIEDSKKVEKVFNHAEEDAAINLMQIKEKNSESKIESSKDDSLNKQKLPTKKIDNIEKVSLKDQINSQGDTSIPEEPAKEAHVLGFLKKLSDRNKKTDEKVTSDKETALSNENSEMKTESPPLLVQAEPKKEKKTYFFNFGKKESDDTQEPIEQIKVIGQKEAEDLSLKSTESTAISDDKNSSPVLVKVVPGKIDLEKVENLDESPKENHKEIFSGQKNETSENISNTKDTFLDEIKKKELLADLLSAHEDFKIENISNKVLLNITKDPLWEKSLSNERTKSVSSETFSSFVTDTAKLANISKPLEVNASGPEKNSTLTLKENPFEKIENNDRSSLPSPKELKDLIKMSNSNESNSHESKTIDVSSPLEVQSNDTKIDLKAELTSKLKDNNTEKLNETHSANNTEGSMESPRSTASKNHLVKDFVANCADSLNNRALASICESCNVKKLFFSSLTNIIKRI